MSKRFILTIVTLIVIALATGVAVFFAKGYSFSAKERRIVGTGIVTITSQPDAASIFIDGHLTTATNATISSLPPKSYLIRIIKEGFIPWERSVVIKEGLVTSLKVTLFPAIPTIYPLTFTGVLDPVLSPDGSKLAYVVPSTIAGGGVNKKAGIWVWTETSNQPIAFIRSSEPHQIASDVTTDFSKAKLKWSSDSKQVLATVDLDKNAISQNNFLLDADKLNSDPQDITPTLNSTLQNWDDDKKLTMESRIQNIKDLKYRKIASDSAVIQWSPDETKFMAGKDNTDMKVYDLEESNYYSIPTAKSYFWLPDSSHIILVEDTEISIVDFDGTNKAVIYAGTFADGLVFPWSDSSRLVIISSSPTPTASLPNLYGINLK